MVSILTSSHFPSPQPPLSPIQPPTPPHVPPAPLQDPPLTPTQPPNRRFKASQVTALTVASLPPCRSDRYWRLQCRPPGPVPAMSTSRLPWTPGEAVGLAAAAAAAVGEFSPSSSFSSSLLVHNTQLLQTWWGIFVDEQDRAKKVSHESHTDESCGRYVSGWRLVETSS